MDRPQFSGVEDLAQLANLDEQILLQAIRERYALNKIYTYVGDILIAVNPFKEIGIYGKEDGHQYRMSRKSTLPPHIFAVADISYQALLGLTGRSPGSQCILISGESGAGKTESTKLIIKQLVELCSGNTQLERQILQVNPLLEAFGNAQTNMNDNSSRFGKYIQLKFYKGQLIGGKISEYLLEKSRVVRQNEGEENFHIFSYLFAGAHQADPNGSFCLEDPSRYRYMTHGKTRPRLFEHFEDLVNAMDMVGFTDDEQQDLFTVIAAILHLGNVIFDVDDNDTAMISDPNGAVKMASKLLGVDTAEIMACLTSMVTVTRGEYVKRTYSLHQAEDARDSMAKTVYGRLFGWIVNKINQLLAPERVEVELMHLMEIGILDIFGFEIFQKNSFEQACINLANEQLQFFFNQHIFKMEQEEYINEGIDWTEIKFIDNQPLLDLFLARPLGLLALLDEESQFPKGTDQSFVDKVNANFSKNQYFNKSPQTNKPVFGIRHYAGKVTYDSGGWLEKNRDTLPAGIKDILQQSTSVLVKTIFRGQMTRTGSLALQGRTITAKRTARKSGVRPPITDGARRKLTVGAQFKSSLSILMDRMKAAAPIFVRCLKPNHLKKPDHFDDTYILDQLLYTGMLETTKIRREGFAVRPTFDDFVNRYQIILCHLNLKGSRDNCAKILQATKMAGWYIGKTKVFLKYHHVEQLSDILDSIGKNVVVLQKIARGFIARRQYRRRLEKACKEKAKLEALLKAAEEAALAEADRINQLQEHDTAKNTKASVKPPPSVPTCDTKSTSTGTSEYRRPQKPTENMGTQMEDDDENIETEILEDDFTQVQSDLNRFGRAGTKAAAAVWFKSTQTLNVLDSKSGRFAEWLHGIISRKDAEKLLQDKIIGCFLIRVSESRFGYTLSFKDRERCRHYMIDQLKNGKFIIIGEQKVHRSLYDLVIYHKKVKISNWDGVLTVPCGQDHGECNYIDLVPEQMYFVLEDFHRQNGSCMRREPASARAQEDRAPQLPPRLYSAQLPSNPLKENQHFPIDDRLLPKIPEEAYNRLIQSQQEQQKYNPLPKENKLKLPWGRRK